jgi:15-cis-phytoene synthase
MSDNDPRPGLPPHFEIALGYALSAHRQAWATLFQLDLKLTGLVAQAMEPLLAQIKLAWWRDMLAQAPDQRAKGEPLLEAISQSMPASGAALAGLATAWEFTLEDTPLTAESLREHCALRAAAYAAMAQVVEQADAHGKAMVHAQHWILGDMRSQTDDTAQRDVLHDLARQCPAPDPLPRALRPLAVLSALGRRAIQRKETVLKGRGSALVALRVGMFGQ